MTDYVYRILHLRLAHGERLVIRGGRIARVLDWSSHPGGGYAVVAMLEEQEETPQSDRGEGRVAAGSAC